MAEEAEKRIGVAAATRFIRGRSGVITRATYIMVGAGSRLAAGEYDQLSEILLVYTSDELIPRMIPLDRKARIVSADPVSGNSSILAPKVVEHLTRYFSSFKDRLREDPSVRRISVEFAKLVVIGSIFQLVIDPEISPYNAIVVTSNPVPDYDLAVGTNMILLMQFGDKLVPKLFRRVSVETSSGRIRAWEIVDAVKLLEDSRSEKVKRFAKFLRTIRRAYEEAWPLMGAELHNVRKRVDEIMPVLAKAAQAKVAINIDDFVADVLEVEGLGKLESIVSEVGEAASEAVGEEVKPEEPIMEEPAQENGGEEEPL